MKNFGTSIIKCLVCLLAIGVASAQTDPPQDGTSKSDAPAQNAKPSDQGPAKPGQMSKSSGKDTKSKTPKSTGNKKGGNTDADPGDGSGADGSMNADGSGPANGRAVLPNWSVDGIRLAPYAGPKYSNGGVTIEPTKGQSLIQASFEIQALRSDAKAVERYAKLWSNVDRKELTRRSKAGVRVLEAKNIALRDPDGRQFAALWSLNEGIRITIVHQDIAPNSQSSRQTSSGAVSPNGPWLDAEQSFITRISRPLNQQPITEYATLFAGILTTEHHFPATFLFSVPEALELESLKLVVDSETFTVEQSRASSN